MSDPTSRQSVAVFAATRADLSPLAPVIQALVRDGLEVTLLAASSLLQVGEADLLSDLGITDVDLIRLRGDLSGSTVAEQTAQGAALSADLSARLDILKPDTFLVLGDRWELLFAVPPVVLRRIPIVHLHGGEVTEGAIDDRVRHAVTKLADLHCVSTAQAAARVMQLGEPHDRVFVTGAPGLDRITEVVPLTDEQLSGLLGAELRRPLALVTYHPVTVGGLEPDEGARNVLEAVAAQTGTAIVTHPGMDRGRDQVLREIERAVTTHEGIIAVSALGSQYLPALAAADVVVGNSSSGIVEAASFGKPVVDVGDRQHGRPAGANVVHCGESRQEVEAALRACLEPSFVAAAAQVTNIYGDGHGAARVLDVVRSAVDRDLSRKAFIDLEERQ